MIVYDLECRDGGHRFEGWFGSSADFASQQERGLVSCPSCGSGNVVKAVMAPRVGRKGNQMPAPVARKPETMPVPTPPNPGAHASTHASALANVPLPPEAVAMMKNLARMQAEALQQSRYVGNNFSENARAMHYGERETESIHGQATLKEAKELLEEGIAIAPLPFPVTPPDEAN